MNVQSIPIEEIAPPAWNSRTTIDEQADKGLQSSLRSEGLKEPIKVRQFKIGTYELIFGTRRLAAAKAIGWTHIPAVVEPTPADPESGQAKLSAMIDNVIENLTRRDLSTYDTARALSELRAPGGDVGKGLKLEDIVSKTGLSKGYVSNLVVTFTKLNPAIAIHWKDGHANAQLSFLRELVNVDHEKQLIAWRERVKLSSEAAKEDAANDEKEEDEGEEDEGAGKKAAPKKSDKYHVETARFNKLVRTLTSKKVPGGALAIQCLKYLVGKQTKVSGIIEDPTED